MLNTVGIFIYTKYWGLLYVEHCGKIYLHKILGNTLCWILWEDLFMQKTWEYFMLNTVGRCIYTKYWKCVHNGENWEWLIAQNARNTLFCTMWESRFQNILANTIHNMHSFMELSWKLYKNLEKYWALLVCETPSFHVYVILPCICNNSVKSSDLVFKIIGLRENVYLLMKMCIKWKFQQQ